jgi:integrase
MSDLVRRFCEPTHHRFLPLVRAILIRARDEWEWIDRAPKVKLFKEGPGRERSITAEQAAALLGELPAHQRDVVIFALATALDVLRRQLGKHPQRVFTFGGQPIGSANTRAWRLALKRAGIENFRWHDLRHTWATWHRQSGTPTHELQRLGGWLSSVMVERYAHLAPDQLAKAASRLDSMLGGYDLATPAMK